MSLVKLIKIKSKIGGKRLHTRAWNLSYESICTCSQNGYCENDLFAAQKSWKLYKLDVKWAFLYGELKENIFIEQSKGNEKNGSEEMVYKLQKALYRLKQAHRI